MNTRESVTYLDGPLAGERYRLHRAPDNGQGGLLHVTVIGTPTVFVYAYQVERDAEGGWVGRYQSTVSKRPFGEVEFTRDRAG